MINALVLDQAERCRPIDVLADAINRQVDAFFVVARGVEGCNASRGAHRFQMSHCLVRLSSDRSAYLLLDVELQDVIEAVTIDAETSDDEDVLAYDETSGVDAT